MRFASLGSQAARFVRPNRRLQLTAFGARDRWYFDSFRGAPRRQLKRKTLARLVPFRYDFLSDLFQRTTMLELPKSLPSLKRSLQTSLKQAQEWQERVEQHNLSDDLRTMIALFHACFLAAIACADGDAIGAREAIHNVLPFAEHWPTAVDGRSIRTNFVRDLYGGIHDDEMNGVYESTASILEDLKDWEYTATSLRATGYLNDEYTGYHSEDAILLCRIQALADCCEAVFPICREQKRVVQPKMHVAWQQIQAWQALVITGTTQY